MLGEAAGNAAPSLASIQAALAADEAIVGWLEPYTQQSTDGTDYDAWAYCLRATGPVSWRRLCVPCDPLPRDAVVAECRTLGTPPGRRDPGQPSRAAELAASRFAPLLTDLAGVERIIAIPSGSLHGFPLEQLPQGGTGGPLLDRFTISYVPSARIFAWQRQAQAREGYDASRPCLVLADPPFNAQQAAAMRRDATPTCGRELVVQPVADAPPSVTDELEAQLATLRSAAAGDPAALSRLERLGCTRREVAEFATWMPPGSLCLVGEDAAEARLADLVAAGRMGEFGVLHFATHATIDEDQPQRSAVILAQVPATPGYDGVVTAAEIGTWKLTADLVCLSACSTALGRRESDEGTLGLSWAFLAAGAQSVLVSLWRVDDESTALLMDHFYVNWRGGRGLGKAEALRQAKLQLRDTVEGSCHPYADPFYWAGFVLLGDAR